MWAPPPNCVDADLATDTLHRCAQDTNEERNLFLGDVMPALQELGRTLKLEIHMCEMRWGIRSEASAAHLTAEICMRELERCLRESVGLSYVFIAAQKYGFRPFPRLIPENLFTQLLEKMADEDRTLLEKWFKLDENALPGDDAGEKEWEGPREFYGLAPGASARFYVLQSQSKLTDGEGWWPLFERMQVHTPSTFRNCIHPPPLGTLKLIRSCHRRTLHLALPREKTRQNRLGGGIQLCKVQSLSSPRAPHPSSSAVLRGPRRVVPASILD